MCDTGIYPEGSLAPTYNFEKMGYKTKYFIMNFADTLVFLTFISMVIPFVSIIRMLLPGNAFLARADLLMRGRFAILLVHIIYFKLAILTVLNIVDFNSGSSTSIFNSLASVAMMMVVVVVPVFYFF